MISLGIWRLPLPTMPSKKSSSQNEGRNFLLISRV